MPKPYQQFVPAFEEPGTVITNWRIVAYSQRKVYRTDTGALRSSIRFYLVECTNCGYRMEKTVGNMKIGGCRNCFLKPEGGAGLNRLLNYYRRNAQKSRRRFALSSEQFRRLIVADCHYCGAPPSKVVGCHLYSSNKRSVWGDLTYNGLDRLDNSLGYTAQNCVSCCTICNRAKNSLPSAEFVQFWRDAAERFLAGRLPAALRATDAAGQ